MHPPASPEYPAQAGPPAPSYPGEEERLSAAELDRSMELDGSSSTADSLALFRSYSMPIPLSAAGSDDEGPLDREAEEDGNEDDEDYDELLTTPTSQLQLHTPSRYASSYQSAGQRLLSCSLPPSLTRQKSSSEYHPLHELLQLTQPMREGVISRERLLPSSRVKQVGIGGRGRRGLSTQRAPGSPSSAGGVAGSPASADFPAWSPGSSCSPLLAAVALTSSLGCPANPALAPVNQQVANPTPLLRPRPIAAWQRPHA
ncbi:hypothetical protein PtA15_13A284 [Puccinia triticina]|uniref:Uncharacterized protein n=1 Tax=Puccinia triticina TaxID=208348 RepID=A0ABY7CZX9_9BASI|nr:uncharacterized protein PtA15_13A284 [Puccinia triticina]WAQ90884.1 hypothetical protein PtA15_13A284 [Puccinia triticina]